MGNSCLYSSIKRYFISISVRRYLLLFLGYHAPVALFPILFSGVDFLLLMVFDALFREMLLLHVPPTPCASCESHYLKSPALALFGRSVSPMFAPSALLPV